MATSTVTLKCSCGSIKFDYPADPKPTDIVKCATCGATGKYSDVMGQAHKQAISAVEKQLTDALRKAGFK